MEVKKTYYGKINGYDAMTCDYIPENMTVEREINVLYPEEGYLLETKNGDLVDNIELLDGDSMENYIERKIEEE